MGNGQGLGRMRSRLAVTRKSNVDRIGNIFLIVAAERRGGISFSRGNHQVNESRVGGVDKVEVMFRVSKGGQGRKEAILVRTVDSACRKRGTVKLVVESTRTQEEKEVLSSLPLMGYKSGRVWKV